MLNVLVCIGEVTGWVCLGYATLFFAAWLWSRWLRTHPRQARPLIDIVPTAPPAHPRYRRVYPYKAPSAPRERPEDMTGGVNSDDSV